MNDSLASTLVLCDLDNLLLGEDGNLTQVVRDVLQLFSSRGGRLTVFSQRSPRAVRSILGSVRLAAPALVCGGTMAYHYADGNRVSLCSFAQQQELFACLPDTPGVGVAVQMQDVHPPQEVSDAILEEAQRLAREGVDEAFYQQLRRASFGSTLRALNSFENIAVSVADGAFRGFDPFRFPEVYDSVTRADVEAFLRESIVEERSALSILIPKKEGASQ